jgi:hypothetical protein
MAWGTKGYPKTRARAELAIVRALARHPGGLTQRELERLLGRSAPWVRTHLAPLRRNGTVHEFRCRAAYWGAGNPLGYVLAPPAATTERTGT